MPNSVRSSSLGDKDGTIPLLCEHFIVTSTHNVSRNHAKYRLMRISYVFWLHIITGVLYKAKKNVLYSDRIGIRTQTVGRVSLKFDTEDFR
jgi:hypothetical protein